MAGYWIIRGSVSDTQALEEYARRYNAIGERFGGRYLTAGGKHQIREGREFDRVVIVEFDSFDRAVACYEDAEYQELIPVALKAYGHDREFTIVDGDGKFTSPD
ncbi:DUF1330 domain-containing protein [Sulfitobacter sp. JBTF-M27]|uniref:DUF1330 domain-containing protein n=1 Tax=Sulfitobacter sediminilitoris TaxID=2698830 RepID=A0A6P0CJP9_9RHOB|nr:DUF1330 domain-containing protein [Sulfitobacter sediminilitoris]NEK25205.1 DUF1330 domain-containing protein [Sulfitobacter sediminilitoris]